MTLWYEFIIWHITTSGEMTKFSLSLCECYIRTEEKCGLLNFSTHGLAVVVKANSPQASKPRVGTFVKPLVGNLFFPIHGFTTHREKSRPYFSLVRK